MIGEKIKKLRKGLHMTQADLAGEMITRNMLSQIENGVATPSLATLSYIAEKLGAPIEYFVSENDELGVFLRISNAKKADNAFKNGDYERCLELIGNATDTDGAFLRAVCLFELGKSYFGKCELLSAKEYFDECLKCAEFSSFAAPTAEAAKKYISVTDNILGRENVTINPDVVNYVQTISERSSAAQRHLEAKSLMAQGRYSDAQTRLGTLLSEAKALGPVCEFFILTDLETCLKHTGDYERAYACAEQRMELKNLMTK